MQIPGVPWTTNPHVPEGESYHPRACPDCGAGLTFHLWNTDPLEAASIVTAATDAEALARFRRIVGPLAARPAGLDAWRRRREHCSDCADAHRTLRP